MWTVELVECYKARQVAKGNAQKHGLIMITFFRL